MHGKRLKKQRDLAGLSQRELARLSGVERIAISFDEVGYTNMAAEQAEAIARILRKRLTQRGAAIRKLLSQEERQALSV